VVTGGEATASTTGGLGLGSGFGLGLNVTGRPVTELKSIPWGRDRSWPTTMLRLYGGTSYVVLPARRTTIASSLGAAWLGRCVVRALVKTVLELKAPVLAPAIALAVSAVNAVSAIRGCLRICAPPREIGNPVGSRWVL
jgi:hypothetical protein